MIDLHMHLLPGLDDGAQSLAEALLMARQAEAEGIETVVVTPHVMHPTEMPRARILEATDALQAECAAAGLSLRLLPGAELILGPGIAEMIRGGELVTLADTGRYLLIEFPFHEVPHYAERVFFELASLGVTPIIAHPERNRKLAENPGELYGFVQRGCLTQICAGSLLGSYGRSARRAAQFFLRRGLAHILATDAHGANRRRIRLAEGARAAAKIAGPAAAEAMTAGRPSAVIKGEEIELPPLKYALLDTCRDWFRARS